MSGHWSADGIAAAALFGVTAVGVCAAALKPAADSGRVAREGGTVFLPLRLMQGGYALAAPLVRLLVAAGVRPAAITWFSLVPGAGAGVAVAAGRPGLGAWLLALSGVCDLLDGAVARATGRVSAGGAALDSTLDRYVEFFFLAGVVWFFAGRPELQLLAMAALLGSFMVTYSTAKAEALGVTPPRGWMKRAERLVWLAAGAAGAGLAPLAGRPAWPVLAAAVGVVAVFANLSAGRRLAALQRSADGK